MKKIVFFMIMFPVLVSAQVFNTGTTLKSGKMTLGSYPLIGDGFSILMKAGYGLNHGLDLCFNIGTGAIGDYFGLDVEKMLISDKKISVSAAGGAHLAGENGGLDMTLNASLPVKKAIVVYSGIDADLVFGDNSAIPIWLLVGSEIGFRSNLNLLFEINIGFNDAENQLGLGFNYYF